MLGKKDGYLTDMEYCEIKRVDNQPMKSNRAGNALSSSSSVTAQNSYYDSKSYNISDSRICENVQQILQWTSMFSSRIELMYICRQVWNQNPYLSILSDQFGLNVS